jgi:hypothetical protein
MAGISHPEFKAPFSIKSQKWVEGDNVKGSYN